MQIPSHALANDILHVFVGFIVATFIWCTVWCRLMSDRHRMIDENSQAESKLAAERDEALAELQKFKALWIRALEQTERLLTEVTHLRVEVLVWKPIRGEHGRFQAKQDAAP